MQAAEAPERGGNGIAAREIGAGPETGTTPIDLGMRGEFVGKSGLANRLAEQEVSAAIQDGEHPLLALSIGRFGSGIFAGRKGAP